jgi:hypothetical protein
MLQPFNNKPHCPRPQYCLFSITGEFWELESLDTACENERLKEFGIFNIIA